MMFHLKGYTYVFCMLIRGAILKMKLNPYLWPVLHTQAIFDAIFVALSNATFIRTYSKPLPYRTASLHMRFSSRAQARQNLREKNRIKNRLCKRALK